MTAPTSTGDLTRDLSQLLAQGASPEEVQRHIFFFDLEKTRTTDPRLAECLRFCAIPRRFDAEIIGVLRQAAEDRQENARLLEALLGYNFVRPREDSGYVYHDNTRDMLLQDWQQTEEKRAEFNQYNERLASYYEARHEEARKTEQDLGRVSQLLERANPDRYMQVVSTVERMLLAPLVEALYHKTQQSPLTGYDFFSRYSEIFEKTGRVSICESLLKACRDFLEDLPASDERQSSLKWLRYWQARLAQRLRRDQEAESILEDLLPQTEDDTKLKLWVLSELGATLHRRHKLRQARQVYEEELRLAQQTREDPYNLPTSHSRVAWLYWSLEELEPAAAKYQDAIQSAREEDNLRVEVYSHLNLCGVLQSVGRFEEALNSGLAALHLARTRLAEDVAIQYGVAWRLMYLLARRDPRLFDTAHAEAEALVSVMADPFQPLELRSQYGDLLRQCGRLKRADQVLAEIEAKQTDYADTSFVSEMLLYRGLLHEDQGRIDEAIELYRKILSYAEDERGTAWHVAAALSNTGMLSTSIANWSEAETALQQAIEKWQEIGHEQLAALMKVALANIRRAQGRMSKARALLDEARTVLDGINPSYLADYHHTLGHLYRDQGKWAAARQEYEQALQYHLSLDNYRQAARNLGELAAVASHRGQWKEAAQRTAEATKLWRRLAAIDRYRPSRSSARADEENARGILLFSEAGDDRRHRVRQARDLFRSASERVPGSFWYDLNLSYASAELGEWADAAEALEAALEQKIEALRCSFLDVRLAELRLKQADQLLDAGDPDSAAELYRQIQSRLEPKVPFEQLAESWLKLGDSELRRNNPDAARAAYEDGLGRALASENTPLQASFHTRLGFLCAIEDDPFSALDHFRHSLKLLERQDPAGNIVLVCADRIASLEEYRAVSDVLRLLASDPALEPAVRLDLDAARLNFSRNRYSETFRPVEEAAQTESARMLPVVTPIAVEADSGLFADDEEAVVDRLIHTYLPAMRERIERCMGVTVPGVRVRSNEGQLGVGGYLITFHEVPLVFGTVHPGEKYCPDAERCRQLGIEGEILTNPDADGEGMWCSEAAWQEVESAGLPLWDPYQFIVFHLETVTRRHLATFLGIQEVHNLLEKWAGDQDERQQLVARAVPTRRDKIRLVQLLQALVREGVPIVELETLLTLFAEKNSEASEVSDLVESARFALRPHLPGNEEDRLLIGLSPHFEESVRRWIWEQHGKRFFALPPQETQDLLSAVRDGVAGRSPQRLALVVRDPLLRPFVRRLLELEFPLLPVLAETEVTPEGAAIAERIEFSTITAQD